MSVRLEDHDAAVSCEGAGPRIPRFALAAAAAAVALIGNVLLNLWFPARLPDSTDVVGYPTWADFNVARYFRLYWSLLLVLPGTFLLAHWSLSVLARKLRLPIDAPKRRPSQERLDSGDPAPAISPSGPSTWSIYFTGSVVGLELAVATRSPGWRLALVAAGSALAWMAVLTLAAGGRPRRLVTGVGERRCALHCVVAPVVVVGLYAVSASTGVLAEGGRFDAYPFLPAWLVAVLAVAPAGWAFSRLRQGVRAVEVERRILLGVAGPACLFLLTARLPGAMADLDLFHEGEALASSSLVRSGLSPWRDVAFIHGLLSDVIRPAMGMLLLSDTRWGFRAGEVLLLVPLYWLAQYALAARLFGRLAVALPVILLASVTMPVATRFVLWPLVLVALAALLREPRARWSALFVVLLGFQVILSPESSFGLVACGLALLGFEVSRYERSRGLLENFPRTARCLLAGLVFSAGWFALLAVFGVAGDLVRQTLMFSRDHKLTGGIPVFGGGPYFALAMVAPVVAVLGGMAYLTARVRSRRSLEEADWLLVATGVMAALYYQKFLSRADLGHVLQSWAVTLPLLLVLASRLAAAYGAVLARMRARGRVSSAILIAVIGGLLVLPSAPASEDLSLRHRLSRLPERFRSTAPVAPRPKLGYATDAALDRQLVDDVDSILQAYLQPGDILFDFTNQPALFHYLLGYRPATRYVHVSMAIRRDTQRELIAELARAHPKLVVFDHDRLGLPAWDGIPNTVRHYEVSQYLLDHYRPLLALHGYLILVARDVEAMPIPLTLTQPPVTDDLLYRTHPCDWGFSPNSLVQGRDDREALELPFSPSPDGIVISIPAGLELSRFRFIEIQPARQLERGHFSLVATDEAGQAERAISFQSTGRSKRPLRVRVGSCPQWHAYTGASLRLRHTPQQSIARVRLIR